jgi:hypothetical protein
MGKRAGRWVLLTLLYPVGLSWALVSAARGIAARLGCAPWLRGLLVFTLTIAAFPLFVLVPSLFLTVELTVQANDLFFVREASIGRGPSGGRSPFAGRPVEEALKKHAWPHKDPKGVSSERRALVEAYSPVFLHQVAHEPAHDVPVFVDFDGDEDLSNNRRNAAGANRLRPGVYGDVTAETEDSYYLTYTLYHARDYDEPTREWLHGWVSHEGDNEGLSLRIEKATMRVREAEGWFHNRFSLCREKQESRGSEVIGEPLLLEGGTHLLAYVPAMGHGVRCARPADLKRAGWNYKIYRYGEGGDAPKGRRVQVDLRYELRDFSRWHGELRARPALPLFTEWERVGESDGRPLELPLFFALAPRSGYWTRPKPMWSWDDPLDGLPGPQWYFLPAETYNAHMGLGVSEKYLANHALDESFGLSAEAFKKSLTAKERERGRGSLVSKLMLHLSDEIDETLRKLPWLKRWTLRVAERLG